MARQGKALAVANAEAVDSSKTLIQSRVRGVSTPQTARTGASPEDRREASDREPDGVERIRISDERSARRGELLLDRYRLIEQLGAGGFGVVWRAHDEQLDRTVALKRIPLPSEEDRERATREAHLTARLSHPAIVALYEASAGVDDFYLISELVEGDTLARLIAEDLISDEVVLGIGLALVDALAHAHARGVIHRDVKPQNVLVPNEGVESSRSPGRPPAVAKLADFGGARLAGDDALTRTGDVFGTLAYMAPEQSEGEDAGPSADLYSLALVLYEAFSGVNPVRGRTPAATARRIGTPIESLARRRRDLPRELTRALDAALVVEPNRRGTLADLHEALAATLERGIRPRLFARRVDARPSQRLPASGWSSVEEDSVEHSGSWLVPAEARVPTVSFPGAHPSTRPFGRLRPRMAAGAPDVDDRIPEEPHHRHRLALPRLLWLACPLAVAGWQATQGHPGASVLLLAAAIPLLALPRRSGPGWLAAGIAPMLGLAGLAGAFPALAGQRADWRARAGLGALGFWWLALAESLFAKRLWLGPPSGLPVHNAWEASIGGSVTHVVLGTLTVELAFGAVAWALAAVILPWLVRGRSAALDVATAVLWTVALLAAVPLLERALLSHASQHASPRGALLGAVLGCALAICARALRGPI